MVESAEASCLEVGLEEWAEAHQLVETCSSELETGSVLMRKIPPTLRFSVVSCFTSCVDWFLLMSCQWMWKPELCLEDGV